VGCLKGIGEACKVLNFPVVSGNVSLYNETNGQGILPTPAIGGVGLIDDVTVNASIAFKEEGEAIILIGAMQGWLGQSIYLRDVCGREEGAPPPVNLNEEKRNGDFIRQLIRSGQVTTVHDCSDGGIALALAEMAIAGCIGAEITAVPENMPLHAFLFGEDQGRYLVAVDEDVAADVLYAAGARGIPAVTLGVTCGDSLILPGQQAISVKQLKAAHEAWLPDYMAGKA
jgi:phosphoribosylformylglycinamidine synthase subunit PurL